MNPDARPERVRELAELHAGLTPDPSAPPIDPALTAEVFGALDATVAELVALRDGAGAQVPMPRDVADRLDALFAGPAPTDQVRSGRPAGVARAGGAHSRRGRRPAHRRRSVIAGLGLAVVVIAGGIVAGLGGVLPGGGTVTGTPSAQRLELGGGDGLGAQLVTLAGSSDLGPLGGPGVLRGCLTANGVPAGIPVLGSAQVVLGGRPGTALLLPAGAVGSFTALVVGPGCRAGEADLITSRRIGAR